MRKLPQQLTKISPGSLVEYEQHGKSILAMAIHEKKGKWVLLNESGGSLELPSARLFLLPGLVPDTKRDKPQALQYLGAINSESNKLLEGLDLEEAWELLYGEVKETCAVELCKLIYGEPKAASTLATRRALVKDTVFFKRKKTSFEPRKPETVEDLKHQAKAIEAKEKAKNDLIESIQQRLQDPNAPLPSNIRALEEVAALGKKADVDKQMFDLIDDVESKCKLKLSGSLEKKAFDLLVAIHHFSPIENLAPIRMGRPTQFTEEELAEAERLSSAELISGDNQRVDLTSLFTVTIDGEETRDFDDSISVEMLGESIRIGIHIADVAALISDGSTLFATSLRRGTSIYCPDQTYPMLPVAASEDQLSLVEGAERPTLSYLITFDEHGEISDRELVRSTTSVDKRLTYTEADTILFDEHSEDHQLRTSLDLIWRAASFRESSRIGLGALQFERRERIPIIDEFGKVTLIKSDEDTPARKLVSELMILANETAALFARDNELPIFFRSQEKSEEDATERIAKVPDGPAREFASRGTLKRSIVSTSAGSHAALGLEAYAQTTSPIRRIIDLLNQRQITHFLQHQEEFYSGLEMQNLREKFETGLSEAAQIQRGRTRFWVLKYLVQEKIKTLTGTVVRIDGPKPMAEVDILYCLFPFHPLKSVDMNARSTADLLGKKVSLRIEKIKPLSESIVLKEME